MTSENDPLVGDLPASLARPARGALLAAGIETLEQLAGLSERDVPALHGMGPKSMPLLRGALAARGLTFAPSPAGRLRSSSSKA